MHRLRAKHRTELVYAGPVAESTNEIRMTPRDNGRQTVVSWSVRIEPETELMESTDAFGNRLLWFQLTEKHRRMVIDCEAVVDVRLPAPPAVEPTWDDLADERLQDELAEYLSPSRYVRWTGPVTSYMAELDLPEEPHVRTWLSTLERRINETVVYSPGSTSVDTPVEEVVHARRGVCQDMAHLAIAICRSRGIPARYVSGWLHNTGHDGPGESHAWIECHLGPAGWIEFDPTHPGMSHRDYVRIGVGRDYADVPPIRGSYLGPPTTSMKVHVIVDEIPLEPRVPG